MIPFASEDELFKEHRVPNDRTAQSAPLNTPEAEAAPGLNTPFSLRGSLRTPEFDKTITNFEGHLTPTERAEFHSKIAMIGYGVYGEALHHRLAHQFDILPWARQSSTHRWGLNP